MIPNKAVMTLNRGIIGSCQRVLVGFLLKREKSEMLTAKVEKPPGTDEQTFIHSVN